LTWRGWDLFDDYSGHLMTNWGAHSVDMIQYALGKDRAGPVRIELRPADIDQFVELLGDLLNDLVLTESDQGQAGNIRIQSLVDTEALNIIAPATEKPGYPGKNPRLVL
jgi:hypothetical protein